MSVQNLFQCVKGGFYNEEYFCWNKTKLEVKVKLKTWVPLFSISTILGGCSKQKGATLPIMKKVIILLHQKAIILWKLFDIIRSDIRLIRYNKITTGVPNFQAARIHY